MGLTVLCFLSRDVHLAVMIFYKAVSQSYFLQSLKVQILNEESQIEIEFKTLWSLSLTNEHVKMSCTCKEISISFSFKVLHLLFTSRSMHDKINGSLIQQGSTFRKKPWGIASKFSDVVARRESFSDENPAWISKMIYILVESYCNGADADINWSLNLLLAPHRRNVL